MKEERRWQNRVELLLDNRQIFLLFFACAVVISLVFALGVVVGKRLEPQPARQAVTDPLAILDQMGQDTSDEDLTFHETLSKGKRLIPLVPQQEPAVDEAKASPREAAPAAPERAPATPVIVPLPAVPERKQAQATAAPQKPEPRLAEKGGKHKAPKQGKVSATVQELAKSEAAAPVAGPDSYTLQLSSFQERSEAEAFVVKLQAAGLKPYMVPAEIPGRGMWYRVRLGSFGSWDAALTAKEHFERTSQIIAYVMRK